MPEPGAEVGAGAIAVAEQRADEGVDLVGDGVEFDAGVLESAAPSLAMVASSRASARQGRTSTKPAALKSPSNANASLIRSRRMISKLVAST